MLAVSVIVNGRISYVESPRDLKQARMDTTAIEWGKSSAQAVCYFLICIATCYCSELPGAPFGILSLPCSITDVGFAVV